MGRAAYVGAGREQNWDALFRTIAIFRRIARQVGQALGYAYAEEMDRRVTAYLHWVRCLEGYSTP
jgi:aminoglycoside 6-adenylyltransferase